MEALRPGDPPRVGRYVLVGRLGVGGMGVVYLGRSPAGRTVAVKVIRERFAGDDSFVARFRREVAAARLVTGAFTAPLLDADPDGHGPWLVTAYVPGISLREAITAYGALPAAAVRALATGIAEALVDIHRAGVVHRDLKPGNIMLTRDGPRVIDFGIARPDDATAITRIGAVLGSPGYMSPEQVTGEAVGPQSDVFSLGAVLVFASTAAEPFGTGGTDEVLARVERAEADLGGVTDRGLRELIKSCLRKDPGRRPAATALLDRLQDDRRPHEDSLPAPLAALIDHRAGQARFRIDAPVAHPAAASGEETIDPWVESRTIQTRPAESRRSSRRMMILGGALAVVGGAAATALSLKPQTVTGLPRTATTSPTAARREPARRWRIRVSTSRSTLTAADGVLLVSGSDAGIRALSPRTGELLWSRDAESIAAADGEVAYLVDPKGWRLTAVDASSGTARWAYDPQIGDVSMPAAVAGPVICCGEVRLNALGVDDGQPRWNAAVYYCRNLVATNNILTAVQLDSLVGLDANTGQSLWTVPFDQPADAQAASGLVFYGDFTGAVYAVYADTGATAWQKPGLGGTAVYWFQVAGDTAYCSADGEVIAMDVATGEPRWSRPLGRRTGTTDPYHNTERSVLGLVANTLYAHYVDGTIYALDAANGDILWSYRTGRRAVRCPVGVDGLVFVATGDGYVEAISPPEGR